MKTGEGKTLVATLPVYLNALTGKGVHVVTVNDYLARRDAEWMGQIYKFLGMTVGVIVHDLDEVQRRDAYNSDITYGTNNELPLPARQHALPAGGKWSSATSIFAIVDEVDLILIDESDPADHIWAVGRKFGSVPPGRCGDEDPVGRSRYLRERRKSSAPLP